MSRCGTGVAPARAAASKSPPPKGKQRTIPSIGEAIREPVSTLSGELQIERSPWHLSESPTHIRLPAPALGEHNEYVFGALLGD